MTAPGPAFPTESGPVQCGRLDGADVHHVGYAPAPWDWADWEHARSGRFQGRWDDPEGHWRAKYVSASPVGCYLEVLAAFRPDPDVQADMDLIECDDEADATVPPGSLDPSWCGARLFCSARLSGDFAVPGHHETLPTLREHFLDQARRLGVDDVDAATVRMSAPRELTQSISAWIYELVGPDGQRIDGIQYPSKHGDDFVLWAIYERGGTDSPAEVTDRSEPRVITPDDEALREAMRIHRIEWL
ncbi:MAG: RES domain-containing protein [Mycobacterium sp.]